MTNTRSIVEAPLCPDVPLQPISIDGAKLYADPAALFEQYEGMVVEVDDLVGFVLGPTKHFRDGSAEIAFVIEPYLPYLREERIFQYEAELTSALMYVSATTGSTLPEVDKGQRISLGGVVGPDDAVSAIMDYNFGKYQLTLLDGHGVDELASDTSARQSPNLRESNHLLRTGEDEETITVCTFNLLGLGRGSAQHVESEEYRQQLQKRALAIADNLRGCTIIGLQETGEPADAENLAEVLRTDFGLDYVATAIEGPGTANLEFPLTNSLLTLRDRVTIENVDLVQGCSRLNYDVRYTPGACKARTYALFNRPPLVVDLEVNGKWDGAYALTVIVNHWKSKGGDESVNVVRRHEQGQTCCRACPSANRCRPWCESCGAGRSE